MAVPIAPSSTRTRSSNALPNPATRSAPMFPLCAGPAVACQRMASPLPQATVQDISHSATLFRVLASFPRARRLLNEGRRGGSNMGNAAQLAQEAEFFYRWAEERAKHLEPLEPAVLERYRRL